ncbi:hypothetical protein K2173_026204 [Erythroxylum novogranatense]|uniref:Uncharacterized protein n=1 Tax=Erythroxylum novogranatense TaxID=1862640 RepID=A0AAV8SBY3_9ROSI|nr:hypothetical protein K2173_026204 [Erythroxylum novogranatense]
MLFSNRGPLKRNRNLDREVFCWSLMPMLQPRRFPGNSDSDQSISEEEEFDGHVGANCDSLAGNTEKVEGLQLQTRLEILRGRHEFNSEYGAHNFAKKKQTSSLAEDEVEMPDFPDDGVSVFSKKECDWNYVEEVISDDEDTNALPSHRIASGAKKLYKYEKAYNFESEKHNGLHASSNDIEAGIPLKQNALSPFSVYSKANTSCQDIRAKVMLNSSLNFQSLKNDLSPPVPKNEISPEPHDVLAKPETIESGILRNSNPILCKDFQRRKCKDLETMPGEVAAVGDGMVEKSMAALLDGLQDKSIPITGYANKDTRRRGKRLHPKQKKKLYPLGDRTIDNEGLASGSSGDDELISQNPKCVNLEVKKQTMSELFQEALSTKSLGSVDSLVRSHKPSGMGLFNHLQQVILSEKERDTAFVQKLQMGVSPNEELGSIIVEILSKYLDAKLTVCCCSFGKNTEEFQCPEGGQSLVDRVRKRTIIFSPKVCSNVDLEVGKLICIYPPWKEVHVVGTNETIMLCAHFSEIVV